MQGEEFGAGNTVYDETHINYQVLLKEMVPPLPIPPSLPTLAVIFRTGVHFTPR